MSVTLGVLFSSILWGAGFPVYEVSVSTQSRDNFIEGSASELSKLPPYGLRSAKPFIYAADFKSDGENAFVVAGVNPTSRLKSARTITGLPLQTLELRMFPPDGRIAGRRPSSVEKAWVGIGNIGIRRSNVGFLAPGQDLRSLLANDNDWVLSRKLTHQELASPLLLAVEAHERAQHDTTFEFKGRTYAVKGSKMAGDSFLYELLKKDDPRRSNRSGWIGFGMQGSPFQDELFANWYFEIALGSKKLRSDALTAQLIHRYGFYQGGKYRLEPTVIHEMFFQ